MEVIPREELLRQLKDMQILIKRCPKDMYFHANVEFSGIDSRFMELGKKFNIEKELRKQKQIQKEKETKGNI